MQLCHSSSGGRSPSASARPSRSKNWKPHHHCSSTFYFAFACWRRFMDWFMQFRLWGSRGGLRIKITVNYMKVDWVWGLTGFVCLGCGPLFSDLGMMCWLPFVYVFGRCRWVGCDLLLKYLCFCRKLHACLHFVERETYFSKLFFFYWVVSCNSDASHRYDGTKLEAPMWDRMLVWNKTTLALTSG